MNLDATNQILNILMRAEKDRRIWLKNKLTTPVAERRLAIVLQNYISEFQRDHKSQCFIVPGLRGTGKTTLLSQIYLDLDVEFGQKIFLSLDRLSVITEDINQVFGALEEFFQSSLEDVNSDCYLFLDEVQYLKNWDLAVKLILDRMPKVFIVCSGSSAIGLQQNPDLTRRSLRLNLYPLSFTEYIELSQGLALDQRVELQSKMSNALFGSQSATAVYQKLQALSPLVEGYWQNVKNSQNALKDYVNEGNLPYVLGLKTKQAKMQTVYSGLIDTLNKDILDMQATRQTKQAFIQLLSLLAVSDAVSLNRLSQALRLNGRTVEAMLANLCLADILYVLSPQGSVYGKVRRAKKYLFTASSMRQSICHYIGLISERSSDLLKGHLLEDVVGLYLRRVLEVQTASSGVLEYDYLSGGADFIFGFLKQQPIAIETGFKKRSNRQVVSSLKRIKGRYGLTISDLPLSLDLKNEAVFVPLKYFVLL